MFTLKIPLILIATCLFLNAGNLKAQEDDIMFIVLGKMAIYNQDASSNIALQDYIFVAEIMPKNDIEITNATLTNTNDLTQVYTFDKKRKAYLAYGGRYLTTEELHKNHDEGTYLFEYTTPEGTIKQQQTLQRRSNIPNMPEGKKIYLKQDGKTVHPHQINPNLDLVVSWDDYSHGVSQTNSIIDDLVFVMTKDADGTNIDHSGMPFDTKACLSYKDKSYTIKAEKLKPGLSLNLVVELATADALLNKKIPAVSTYSTITSTEIKTLAIE
jgi:hypothetical protein